MKVFVEQWRNKVKNGKVDFKIYSFIYDINDFDKLSDIIADCKKKQRKLLNEKWKSLYKERCTKYYVDLEQEMVRQGE